MDPKSNPAGRPDLHRCPVPGCGCLAPRRLLMCAKHWCLVPDPIQLAVWTTWRENNRAGHLAAVKAAIRAVSNAPIA